VKKKQPTISQSPDIIVERRLTAFRKTIVGMEEAWKLAGEPFGKDLSKWSSFWLRHNYFPPTSPARPAPAPRTTPYPPECPFSPEHPNAGNPTMIAGSSTTKTAVLENSNMISLSIDLRLLDSAKIKHMTRKSGAEASFLNLVLIETPGGQYGDYMVKQESTKEERAAKTQTPILGNGKTIVLTPR
jgi:hypothetical protein